MLARVHYTELVTMAVDSENIEVRLLVRLIADARFCQVKYLHPLSSTSSRIAAPGLLYDSTFQKSACTCYNTEVGFCCT